MKTHKTNSIISNLLNNISEQEQKKTDAKMIIAAKIDDAIRKKGWKKKDLLQAMGKKNPSLVTKWLSGTHNFTMDTLVELEDVLDIELLNIRLEPAITFSASFSAESQTILVSSFMTQSFHA